MSENTVNVDEEIMASNLDGGEVMEVMMTGGDGTAMNEDTLAQVVNMLQMEGQLSAGSNHTIIIRQSGSDEVQMITASSGQDGEFEICKASADDISALQTDNLASNQEIIDAQQGQVMMVDEAGNIVEGVVQLPHDQVITSEAAPVSTADMSQLLTTNKIQLKPKTSSNLLTLNSTDPVENKSNSSTDSVPSVPAIKPNNFVLPKKGNVVIKVDTGTGAKYNEDISQPNHILITTTTGRQKYQPPKFHKCEACVINFVSKIAYMNHMEKCVKQKNTKSISQVFSCIYCHSRFPTKPNLLMHTKVCDKSKNKLINSKNYSSIKSSPKGKNMIFQKSGFKKGNMFEDDPDDPNVDDSDEQNGAVPFDEDVEMAEKPPEKHKEETVKKSQKHLGPIFQNGMLKCRDCKRIFSKENQYNKHVKGCSNSSPLSVNIGEPEPMEVEDHGTSIKKLLEVKEDTPKKAKPSPQIVSVDPKKLQYSKLDMKKSAIINEEKKSKIKPNKPVHNHVSKIVKVSPGDILNKRNQNIISRMSQPKAVNRTNPICGLCGEKFKSIDSLGSHIQNSHSEDLVNVRDLLDGKRVLSSVKCPLCQFYYNSRSLLLHMTTVHSKELKGVEDELEALNLNLVCPYCTVISLSQELFKEHIVAKHFEKVVNRPQPSVSPLSMDVDFIKSKANITLPVQQEEQVFCPGCNIYLECRFYNLHKCIAEDADPTSKKFICSESQCSDLFFYKVDHLLIHFIQVHNDLEPSEEKSFENLCSFMDWLKMEESKTKMKYSKRRSILRYGKLHCTWLCHHFHNSLKGYVPSLENRPAADQMCYSRINVQTDFSSSSLRHDGYTTVRYFSNHQHKPLVNNQKKSEPVQQQDFTTNDAAFSDANQLKNLLEEDDSPKKLLTPTRDQEPFDNDSLSTPDAKHIVPDHAQKSLETPERKTDKEKEEMMAETELLLEKMLGEHDSTQQIHELEPISQPEESLEELMKTDKMPSLIQSHDKLDEILQSEPKNIEDKEKEWKEEKEIIQPSIKLEELLQDSTKIDDILPPDDGNKMENILQPEESNKMEDILQPKDSNKMKDIIQPEDRNKVEDILQPEESNKIEDVLQPDEGKKMEDILQPEESNKMDDILQQSEENNKLDDILQPKESNKMDDILQSDDTSKIDKMLQPDEKSEAPQEQRIGDMIQSETNLTEIMDTDDKLPQEVMETDEKTTEEMEVDDKLSEMLGNKIEDEEMEENTYVLPADLSEWKKMFELVRSQITSKNLEEEDISDAQDLLKYSDQIQSLPIETQVDLFTKLCRLANVQMS